MGQTHAHKFHRLMFGVTSGIVKCRSRMPMFSIIFGTVHVFFSFKNFLHGVAWSSYLKRVAFLVRIFLPLLSELSVALFA